MHLPRMTKPWRNVAVTLAILGFAAAAIAGDIVGAAINALIWFGVAYLAFLVGRRL